MNYLLIGHVCRDIAATGYTLGGTVSFSGLVAAELGWRTSIFTAASEDIKPLLNKLDGLTVEIVPSKSTTTFENIYHPLGRQQILHSRADDLDSNDIPTILKQSDIIHLAPIAQEVSADIIAMFSNSMLCATPQGWLRAWDEQGVIRYQQWRDAEKILPYLQAVVLSIEDINGDEAVAQGFASMTPLLILTRGSEGCTLFREGVPLDLSTHRVQENDPTGAGDIFATAFFTEYYQHNDPVIAARFALFLATESVQYSGLPRQESIAKAREIVYGG